MEKVWLIYDVWALLCYLAPTIFFYRRTCISPGLTQLDGFVLHPVYSDTDQNVVSMDNNFVDYLKSHPALDAKNWAVKVSGEICADGKAGKKYNAEYYIFHFKTRCTNFLYYVFLALNIPLIVLIVLNGGFIPANDLVRILPLHIFGFILVAVMKKLVDDRVNRFTECLYRYWYDRILNFDMITLGYFKKAVIDSLSGKYVHQLIAAAQAFSAITERHSKTLNETTEKASAKLDEFLKLDAERKNVTW